MLSSGSRQTLIQLIYYFNNNVLPWMLISANTSMIPITINATKERHGVQGGYELGGTWSKQGKSATALRGSQLNPGCGIDAVSKL